MPDCILCEGLSREKYQEFDNDPRKYYLCESCGLIQVDKIYFPTYEKAKKRYGQHKEDAGSEGHITHLMKALQPSLPYLKKESMCLDYGCGPKPILSDLLKKQGFHCDNYDPCFGFHIADEKKYDHIFCLETAEHFEQPAIEFKTIFDKLKPGGTLTLMTERYKDIDQFSDWYYKRDFTHVIFFNQTTLLFMENKLGAKIVYDDNIRVTIFLKAL